MATLNKELANRSARLILRILRDTLKVYLKYQVSNYYLNRIIALSSNETQSTLHAAAFHFNSVQDAINDDRTETLYLSFWKVFYIYDHRHIPRYIALTLEATKFESRYMIAATRRNRFRSANVARKGSRVKKERIRSSRKERKSRKKTRRITYAHTCGERFGRRFRDSLRRPTMEKKKRTTRRAPRGDNLKIPNESREGDKRARTPHVAGIRARGDVQERREMGGRGGPTDQPSRTMLLRDATVATRLTEYSRRAVVPYTPFGRARSSTRSGSVRRRPAWNGKQLLSVSLPPSVPRCQKTSVRSRRDRRDWLLRASPLARQVHLFAIPSSRVSAASRRAGANR